MKGGNNKPERLAPQMIHFIETAEYSSNILMTIDTHADVHTGHLVFAGKDESAVSASVDDVRILFLFYIYNIDLL
jgi:hypothetical protein